MNSNCWIDIAVHDIESCRVLYKNGNYSQSLFHFHQSVEKCTKHIALIMGGFDEKELKSFSHNLTKVFKEMARKFNSNKEDFDNKHIDYLIRDKQNTITNGKEDIAIHTVKKIINCELKDLPTINDKSIKDYYLKFCEEFAPNNLKDIWCFYEHEEAYSLRLHARDIYIKDHYGPIIIEVLFMLSMFLSRYKVDDFRYPSDKIGNPINYFNKEHIWTKDAEYFIHLMESFIVPMVREIKWDE